MADSFADYRMEGGHPFVFMCHVTVFVLSPKSEALVEVMVLRTLLEE